MFLQAIRTVVSYFYIIDQLTAGSATFAGIVDFRKGHAVDLYQATRVQAEFLRQMLSGGFGSGVNFAGTNQHYTQIKGDGSATFDGGLSAASMECSRMVAIPISQVREWCYRSLMAVATSVGTSAYASLFARNL